MFDDNGSVFHLIEKACLKLAKVSYNINIGSSDMSKKDELIYSRMLWGK